MGLTKKQVSEIRLRTQKGERGCDLAIEFDVSKSLISQIKNRKKCVKQVWLTLEEAKELEAMTYDFLETFESQFDVPEWNRYVKLHQLLEKRIKQVEKKDE